MGTIVSFDDLKAVLVLSKTTLAEYPQLSQIADSVHAALESFTARKLDVSGKVTETGYIVDTADTLSLKNLPLIEVSSVVVDGDSVDFAVGPYGVHLTANLSGAWTVVSKGGFKTIPSAIYRAELMQIVYEYQNINNLATKSFNNDGGSTQTNEGFAILKEVQRLLAPFVHIDKMGY